MSLIYNPLSVVPRLQNQEPAVFDPEDIWDAGHGKLYTHWRRHVREPIDSLEELENMDLFDDNGEEICIYQTNGMRKISRSIDVIQR